MPSVSVRERVNPNEAMVKPHRELVWFVGPVLPPITRIFDEISDFLANRELIYTDVLVGRSDPPRPSPDRAEHSLVQLVEELLGENVDGLLPKDGTALGPFQPRLDIGFLQLIQLLSRRDVAQK
jgi:hypothetical protein